LSQKTEFGQRFLTVRGKCYDHYCHYFRQFMWTIIIVPKTNMYYDHCFNSYDQKRQFLSHFLGKNVCPIA
jgi:hypothetical protein